MTDQTTSTRNTSSALAWAAALLLAATTVACGSSAQDLSPTAPSGAGIGSTSLESSDMELITMLGGGPGRGGDDRKDKDRSGRGHDAEDSDGRDDDEDSDDEDSDEDSDGDSDKRGPRVHTGPLEGTVSSFRGECPTVTFNLKGIRVVTTATTAYVPAGSCAKLRPNVKVIVTGAPATVSPTHRPAFTASKITIVSTPTTTTP